MAATEYHMRWYRATSARYASSPPAASRSTSRTSLGAFTIAIATARPPQARTTIRVARRGGSRVHANRATRNSTSPYQRSVDARISVQSSACATQGTSVARSPTAQAKGTANSRGSRLDPAVRCGSSKLWSDTTPREPKAVTRASDSDSSRLPGRPPTQQFSGAHESERIMITSGRGAWYPPSISARRVATRRQA